MLAVRAVHLGGLPRASRRFACITATVVAVTDAGDIGEVMATLVRRVAYQPPHCAFLAGQAGHGARPVVRGDVRDLVRDTADDPA